MYNFKDRFLKLISLDLIRICKIFEIFQYSLIFLVLLVITMYLLNKYYYDNDYELKNKVDHKSLLKKKIHIFYIIFRDTFLIILALFYLKKIALLFPSIPSLLYPKFKEHTTLEYSIHIALVVVFIELLPKYKEKIAELRHLMLQ